MTLPNLPDPELLPEFYAHVPLKRLVAWGVDGVLIFILTGVVLIFTALLTLAILPILYVALNVAYRWVSLARWSATPGMALMAIELRNRRGERIDRETALWHTLLYTGCMITVVPQVASVAMMLVSPRNQGLGDTLLGTVMLNRPAGG
jgi:uncharacterized RDD family membrane protein YckC